MRLNDKQTKQVTSWIKRNARKFYTKSNGYDCTVMAEACERELGIYGAYNTILREVEYYVTNL